MLRESRAKEEVTVKEAMGMVMGWEVGLLAGRECTTMFRSPFPLVALEAEVGADSKAVEAVETEDLLRRLALSVLLQLALLLGPRTLESLVRTIVGVAVVVTEVSIHMLAVSWVLASSRLDL